MANEEQKRAFASYMGTSGAHSCQSQGQSISQYPGSVASPGNPYLLHVFHYGHYANPPAHKHFPGIGAPPAPPTPPPTAPSSVSYPCPQAGYNAVGFLQRLPTLGQAETSQAQQYMTEPPRPPGYVQLPRNYNAQPPPAPGYNVGWQYMNPMVDHRRQISSTSAAPVIAAPQDLSRAMVESTSKQREQYRYHHYENTYGAPEYPAPPLQVEELSVPVMLCHTCSHCGRLRSVGFHRNNPVLPGKPLICQPCRRCKKKTSTRCRSAYTHIRSCTADRPCNWPCESGHLDFDQSEHRGRRRDRDEIFVTKYSNGRPRILKQSSSQTRLGLGVLQQSPRNPKTETRVRVSSLSPLGSSRYGEVWPPPDVVRIRPSRSNEVFSTPGESFSSPFQDNSEVWPPPDVVRTHSYRKVKKSPSRVRRVSSRIIELSPSPPPARSKVRRGPYRSKSQRRRSRSRNRSPVQVRLGRKQRKEGTEAYEMAHFKPYQSVLPDHRTFSRESDLSSSNNESIPSRQADHGILKATGADYETSYRRRRRMRDSEQSTSVEVGGPRVQFSADRKVSILAVEPGDRGKYDEIEESLHGGNHKHYHEYSRHRYKDEPPQSPSPPIEEFKQLRFRHLSPFPRRRNTDEAHINRPRHSSSSPPPPPTRLSRETDRYHSHHISQALPSQERPTYSTYRHISPFENTNLYHSLSPSRHRRTRLESSEDMTDSDSNDSGNVTQVRTWTGIDEHGRPATFVEHTTSNAKRLARGGEFEQLGNERRAGTRWRDV